MVAPLIILGAMTAASILAPYIAKEAARAAQPASIQKELAKPSVQQAISSATQEVSGKQPGINLGGFQLTAYDIPGAQAFLAGEVQKSTEQRLIAQGYSATQAKQIAAGVGAMKTAEGVGEAAGILSVSAGSAAAATKIAGKGITSATIKQAGKVTTGQLTKQVTKASAIAGAYEGVASTAVSTSARESRLPTPIEATVGGILGMGSAAAGGYLLTKAYLRGPKTGKLADWIGSTLVDPYEKPGDVIAGLKIKSPKASVIKGSGITITPSVTATTSATATEPVTGVLTPAGSTTPTPATTPTTEPTWAEVITPADGETPTPPVPTPTEVPSEVPSEVPVTTPTVTTTPVTVPSSTIMPRTAPALPIPGMLPGGGAGSIRKGQLVYYNELFKARMLASRMLMY